MLTHKIWKSHHLVWHFSLYICMRYQKKFFKYLRAEWDIAQYVYVSVHWAGAAGIQETAGQHLRRAYSRYRVSFLQGYLPFYTKFKYTFPSLMLYPILICKVQCMIFHIDGSVDELSIIFFCWAVDVLLWNFMPISIQLLIVQIVLCIYTITKGYKIFATCVRKSYYIIMMFTCILSLTSHITCMQHCRLKT